MMSLYVLRATISVKYAIVKTTVSESGRNVFAMDAAYARVPGILASSVGNTHASNAPTVLLTKEETVPDKKYSHPTASMRTPQIGLNHPTMLKSPPPILRSIQLSAL